MVGTNGIPEGVRDQYYKDFAPRGGIVWDPTGTGNHTIRGNFGVYYESLIHNIFEPVMAPLTAFVPPCQTTNRTPALMSVV